MKNILYRAKQKFKYHLTSNFFEKSIAEINRYERIISYNASTFQLKGCDLRFSNDKHVFILEKIDLFRKLLSQEKFAFSVEDDILICYIEDIKISVTTAEELFIVNEIWVEGCYNVELNTSKPMVVIDVGMNVGYASLFFAAINNIAHVYSYEPFKPTFEQSKINLQMNPISSSKIEPNNIGLSSHESTPTVDYSPSHRGRTGVWGTELVLDKTENVVKEKLILKSFNEEVRKIVEQNPESEFIWKIDCEGSEYDIFKIMDISLLKNVRAILLEWHKNGPIPFNNILKENGFTILSFNSNSNKAGMIYAFK